MASGMQTVIYPVNNLASAKKIYTALLGSEPMFDSPAYVGGDGPSCRVFCRAPRCKRMCRRNQRSEEEDRLEYR